MATVRFALAGYGAWGSHHARAIEKAEGAQLAAITARSEPTRMEARQAHPRSTVYADYRQMIGREDVDVVDVVLPSHLHFKVGQAALQAGKHLLMEKPMALEIEQCRQLIDLARSRERLLAVGFELRLSELWGRVKTLLDEGAIGRPQYAVIELWRRPYRLGSEGWRFDIDRVGSWILEEPVHFFDLARWYFNPSGEPLSVYACANSRQSGHPELQDNFTAVLKFPGDAHVVITQTLSAFEHHQAVKVTGTQGALWASWSGAMDRDLHPTSSLKHFDGQNIRDVPLARPTGEVYELEDEIAMMVRAVREGAPLAANGRDGLWAVALCQAAQESIRGGGELRLDPLTG